MKKVYIIPLRTIALVLTVTMLITLLVGCKDDSDGESGSSEPGRTGNQGNAVNWASTVPFETPEFIYLTEIVNLTDLLPDGVARISGRELIGDILYCTARIPKEYTITNVVSERTVEVNDTYIFSYDTNTMEVIQLPDFKPTHLPKTIVSTEGVIIQSNFIRGLDTAYDGNVIFIEELEIYSFDVPDDINLEEDNINLSEYRIGTQKDLLIRKIDSTGADIIEPISIIKEFKEIMEISGGYNFNGVVDDAQGNYIISYNDADVSPFYICDYAGKILSKLISRSQNPWNFLRMLNGNIAVYMWGSVYTQLWEIDVENKSWGPITELFSAQNLKLTGLFALHGNDEFPIIYTDNTDVLGYNPDTNEREILLNRNESGIFIDYVQGVSILEDGRLLFVHWYENNETGSLETQIIFIKKVTSEELQNRTILTLAALALDTEINNTVSAFNAASSTHFIQVIDYSVYAGRGADGWMAALDKLSLDITTGKIPDMLAVSGNLPLQRYATMGLLEDLYPFLDGDSELGRESFVDGVLRGIEINDRLYRMLPSFGISTIIGNPYFLGDTPGWDMDEFQAVLRNNPQADIPLGSRATKNEFLNSILFFIDRFADWESGTADFDNDRFIRLLETINTLPMNTGVDPNQYGEFDLIATGRQIMQEIYFVNIINQYQAYKTLFGGDIVFKGYPSDSREGSVLYTAPWSGGVTMTVTCADKDGAWEFIRTFLLENWQRKNVNVGISFPVNKVVFDNMLERAMVPPKETHISWFGYVAPAAALTEEDADKIREVIANATSSSRWEMNLWNIVSEETSKYFNGQGTAADAARIIQNRISILMSEQAG